MNIGNILLIDTFVRPVTFFFFSFLIRRKERTNVIGIIAIVLVNFTMVAYAKTVPFVPCRVSHVDAAPVTEEVLLIAVPANKPNPELEPPSMEPSVGKIIPAITLNKKITEIACAISSSSASITGAVAAMAEPPQIDEPTPISVDVLAGTFNNLCIAYATSKEAEIVDKIIGRDARPTFAIVVRFNPKPNRMTAYCNIFFDVNQIPSDTLDLSFMISVRIIPIRIAMTGAPMTSIQVIEFTSTHANNAMTRHNRASFPLFFAIIMRL